MRRKLIERAYVSRHDRRPIKKLRETIAQEIIPAVSQLEGKRKRLAILVIANLAVGAGLLALAYYLIMPHQTDSFWLWLHVLVLISLLVGGLPSYLLTRDFRNRLKERVFPTIADSVGLRYTDDTPLFPIGLFKDSGVLPHFDRHEWEDGFESISAGPIFSSAEAALSIKRQYEDGSDFEVIWRGLLIVMRARTPVPGVTILTPPRRYSAKEENRLIDRVQLDVGASDTAFDVRSSQPEEARRILTARTMSRLKRLQDDLAPDHLLIGLMRDHLLIGIRSKKDWFECGSIWRPMDDPDRIDGLLGDFATLLDTTSAVDEALGAVHRSHSGHPAETSHP